MNLYKKIISICVVLYSFYLICLYVNIFIGDKSYEEQAEEFQDLLIGTWKSAYNENAELIFTKEGQVVFKGMGYCLHFEPNYDTFPEKFGENKFEEDSLVLNRFVKQNYGDSVVVCEGNYVFDRYSLLVDSQKMNLFVYWNTFKNSSTPESLETLPTSLETIRSFIIFKYRNSPPRLEWNGYRYRKNPVILLALDFSLL